MSPRSTRIFHLFWAATALRPSEPPGNRLAVVNNFAHAKQLDWLRDFPKDEVGVDSPRSIGESRPWLQWIVDHYDTLPEVVVFLHGDETAWHHEHPMDLKFLRRHTPRNVTMLSDKNCVWRADLPRRVPDELPGLDLLYGAFWGISFQQAFERFHMAEKFICCSENMVSRGAIRRFSKPVYQQLLKTMDDHRQWRWGWIMERSWQNLWSAPTPLPDAEIIQRLKKTLAPNSFLVLRKSDDSPSATSSVQAVLKAAARCGDPM
mmetsp:Transcript_127659/g.303323  ORF Transcript_127659/g.303323 Transcript_127659/m.303323 type:complete len:262 (-) Transcript_127659:94-879(-)